MALGVDPVGDDSPAGRMVSEAVLEGRTRTTTRSRRSL
jgi:hypothetical protein